MKFNHQKGFIVPLIGGIVALLIAGGVYVLWQVSKITEVTVNNQPVASSTDFYPNDLNGKLVASSSAQQNYYGGLPANKSSEQTSGPTTSDWKTYTDSSFGFSFSYPSAWQVGKQGNIISLSTGETGRISDTITEIASSSVDDSTGKWGEYLVFYDATTKQWMATRQGERDGLTYNVPIVPSQSTTSGLPILNGGYMSHGWGAYDYIVPLNSAKILLVRGGESVDTPFNANTDQLLKFTRTITATQTNLSFQPSITVLSPNGGASSTSDWKTYMSTKLGLQFKYPGDYLLHEDDANNQSVNPLHTFGITVASSDTSDSIRFVSFDGTYSPESFSSTSPDSWYSPASNVKLTIDGHKTSPMIGHGDDGDSFTIFTGDSKRVVRIETDADSYSNLSSIDLQILSSLKFTN
jgi:hypothetical protein